LTRQTAKKKRLQFQALHDGECFILPNPWDVGSVRMLVHLGFKALASISTGFALSTGRPDYALSRDEALRHLAALNEAADLPINADFESGFAEDAEGVAQSVKLAIEAGGAGLSIEDRDVSGPGLYGITESVDRIKAAGAAIDETGENVVLVARTEGLLLDAAALKPAIEKLVAFADAGADCLYAPGARDHRDIAELVSAVAPKPLNVVMMLRRPYRSATLHNGSKRIGARPTETKVSAAKRSPLGPACIQVNSSDRAARQDRRRGGAEQFDCREAVGTRSSMQRGSPISSLYLNRRCSQATTERVALRPVVG
jgi:2-methylisocitrate lyase-like PEP mutase family enzyme